MGHVAQFQQAQVGQHAEQLLDEGQQAGHDEAGRHGPQTRCGAHLFSSAAERLVVDHAHDHVEQHGHGAGEQADVDQLAAAADAVPG